jgi:hypothetical protein
MKAFFSKRHEQALADKKLKPSFSVPCRTSILRLLSQYSEFGGYDGTDNETFLFVQEELKTFYGAAELMAYDKNNKRVAVALPEFVLGCYPSEVLDVIECWLNNHPPGALECERELNDALVIHGTPWRVINAQVMLVDIDYLHRELQANAVRLFREQEIGGALEEYQEALNDLTAGEAKDAISKAHKSVESVMKAVLQTDEPLRFGQLLARLVASGIIPPYYEDFCKNFEQIVLAVGKERNLPGRAHGQGRLPAPVSTTLAEFAVNLAGAMNVFIVKNWIETKQRAEKQNTTESEDIPF